MKITIHNTETNKITERDMTEDEISKWRLGKDDDEEKKRYQARESAFAKLAALGLTEDEIAAL